MRNNEGRQAHGSGEFLSQSVAERAGRFTQPHSRHIDKGLGEESPVDETLLSLMFCFKQKIVADEDTAQDRNAMPSRSIDCE
jgi:hypothetical protein